MTQTTQSRKHQSHAVQHAIEIVRDHLRNATACRNYSQLDQIRTTKAFIAGMCAMSYIHGVQLSQDELDAVLDEFHGVLEELV